MRARRFLEVLLGASLATAFALAACSESEPAASADAGSKGADAPLPLGCDYPEGPYGTTTNDIVADMSRPDASRGGAPVSLGALRRCGEADAPRLLVLRITAGFCGTCRWSAQHTQALLQPGIQLIDVLVRGDEGGLPTLADAARWGELRGVDVPTWLDPENVFRDADPALVLPAFVFVDPRTMKVEGVLSGPEGDAVVHRENQLLAFVSGGERVPPVSFPRYDGAFAPNEWDMIQAMAQPADFAPPPDPTDRHADDPRAAALGARLFEDASFSESGTVSCQTCHDPARAFTDGLRVAAGMAQGDRNSPSVLFAAHQKWQFWDGRVDTLWAQALGPLENDLEIGATRLSVVHRVAASYRSELEALYGPIPDLSDAARFPARGKPGQPAWDRMQPADQEAVTRTFVAVGKAIAAFERTLRAEDSPLDRYARGDVNALTLAQKLGLRAFFSAGCAQCHYGPRLTDDAFHVVRFATGRRDGSADVGRSEGLRLYAEAEFGASTRWSDAPVSRPESLALLGQPSLVGQFKTPSLRGVAVTAPYGHGGSETDLTALTGVYRDAGLAEADPRAAGTTDPWVPQFDVHAQHDLGELLAIFTAVRKPRP